VLPHIEHTPLWTGVRALVCILQFGTDESQGCINLTWTDAA
jgi:hypothetical protein